MPRSRVVAHAVLAFALSFIVAAAHAATITVNSIADAVANDGQCTLREAIIAANTNTASGAAAGECAAGGASPTIDVIAFNIPGAGVHMIAPAATLPAVTEIVTIDGYTQPGSSVNTLAIGNNATLLVEIDAHNVPNDPVITFNCCNTGGSTIRGLVLSHFTSVGIQVGNGFGSGANGITITGNFIGTNPAGTALSGGGTAISVVTSTATTIGGTTPALRNLIVGTAGGGGSVIFLNASSGNLIQGNYIGVNASGTAGLGGANGAIGLVQGSSNNLIGGAAAGAGNVIGGYTAYGITLEGNGNVMQGNFIGTNATGTAGLGAGGYGIIVSASTGTQIGGTAAGAGNLISGNGNSGIKIVVGPILLLVQGNKIGTNLAGTGALGNGQCGIEMSGEGGSGGNGTIGGTTAAAANTIAFNGTHGIGAFASFSNWAMLGNSITQNTGLGISLTGRCDMAAATPTPNDTGDGDTGPDLLQNYPVLTSANLTPGNVALSGTLNSTPSTAFRVEFFANPLCDASGHGEGKAFLGFANVSTDASGNATFGPLSFAVPANHFVFTATATDLVGGVTPHDTSEFSACIGSPRILDIDDNGAYDALTDGLLVLRNLFGLTGAPLVNGAIGANANRTTAPQIEAYIDSVRAALDIDGNGQSDALTDGLMIIRYLFGLRGASLINNAVGTGAKRTTSTAVEDYMVTLTPP